MGIFILKRKYYAEITNYDRYNTLRNMNDSDILAEKKKVNPVGVGQIATNTAIGTAVGAIAGVGRGLFHKGGGNVVKSTKQLATLGATLGAGVGMAQRSSKQGDIDAYNNRLEMAQRGARRRERLDWNKNMMGKTDYTY